MITAWKSYNAFTSKGYKLIMFVIVPVLFVLVNSLVQTLEIMEEADIVWLGTMIVLYVVDGMTDHWLMGGFYAKNNSSLEFLQTSNYFPQLMEQVVVVDIVRRGVSYIALSYIAVAIGRMQGYAEDWYIMFSDMPFALLAISQICALISRHFIMWNHVYICIVIGMIVFFATFIAFSVVTLAGYGWVLNALLLLVWGIASVITVVYTRKKVRDSFYDK